MAQLNRQQLKDKFKNGLKPTENDFADLIDSSYNLAEAGSNMTINGTLTVNALEIVNGTRTNRIATHVDGDLAFHMQNANGTPNLNELGMRLITRPGMSFMFPLAASSTESGSIVLRHASHAFVLQNNATTLPGAFMNASAYTGADFAEYFESETGKAIDFGTAVAIGDHGKIHPAKEGEIPIGIISANPIIAGNNPPEWPGKYLRNEWGQFIVETYEDEDAESGEMLEKQRLQRNPEYDPDREYVLRSQREEWCCVGLLGQLPLRKGQPIAPGWVKLYAISNEVDMWLVK